VPSLTFAHHRAQILGHFPPIWFHSYKVDLVSPFKNSYKILCLRYRTHAHIHRRTETHTYISTGRLTDTHTHIHRKTHMHIGSDIVIYTTETCIDNTDKHIQRHGHTQTCTYKELVLKLLFNLRLKYSRLCAEDDVLP
jgi:hypothetical protein